MDQPMTKKGNILKFFGVFMQFCLLSASKKQKITNITSYETWARQATQTWKMS